ncbi:MAG: outer membrane lipoprotein-sorting protein [Deltaproteobacteria bacterium]|nr:outer membrane lipoprotein-sorting protein [Deltaproteobacteria bacterium]
MLKIVDEFRAPTGTFSFQVNVKDYLRKQLLRENIYRVFSKEGRSVLVETIAPARLAGRKLLMASTLWMFLPSLKRPTQVSLQGRLTGEVSNGDIARTQFARDYSAKIERADKKEVRLFLTANSKTAAYRHVRLVTTREGQPIRAEFYAISGKLLKTGEYSEAKDILGAKRLTRVLIKDAIDPNKQSLLIYSAYHREVLDDSFFDKESLVE